MRTGLTLFALSMAAGAQLAVVRAEVPSGSAIGLEPHSCVEWIAGRSLDNPPAFQEISPDLACYDGYVSDQPGDKLIAWLGRRRNGRPQVVVRSRGGPVTAGMAMGRAILESRATVRVKDLCASSCANYIFFAAPKRIVEDNSAVLFHGGVSMQLIDEAVEALREALEAAAPGGGLATESNIRRNEASLRNTMLMQLAEQRALMEGAGIDASFLERFGDVRYSEDERQGMCTGDGRRFVILTRRQYEAIGAPAEGYIIENLKDVAGIKLADQIMICLANQSLVKD